MKSIKYFVICIGLIYNLNANSQLTNLAHGSKVFNTFITPGNPGSPYGDILFSRDGNDIYMIENTEFATSFVSKAEVTRDIQGNVIAMGEFVTVFSTPFIDTGLTYAPNSDTLFYYITNAGVTHRTSKGLQEVYVDSNYNDDYGGLAFIPEKYSNGGQLLKVDFVNGEIWKHQVSDDGDETYTLSPATLVSSLVEMELGDIEYITQGPLSDHLIIANYIDETFSLFTIPVNSQTGLPEENPVMTPFASTLGGNWGLAIDPITNNLWVVNILTPLLTQIVFNDVVFNNGFE
ncbi:MAG: hypothetical protein AB8B80_17295 [Marinicellaceae bacterium]